MDQIKIGKFIAECRKEKGFTQMQLAEKLGITDKAISKWERGLSMPDSSIMLTLCDMLGISVNELLNGEKIMMEHTHTACSNVIKAINLIAQLWLNFCRAVGVLYARNLKERKRFVKYWMN